MFVKNFLFDSLFLMNLMFPLRMFCVFWKGTIMDFYSWEMGVWNVSQTLWDSFQTLYLMLKNLSFIVSGTLG